MSQEFVVLAYFGPEVQMPLLSAIGAISGMVLIVGGAPIRLARRWYSRLKDRGKSK